jgi:hypothetical protein
MLESSKKFFAKWIQISIGESKGLEFAPERGLGA